MQATTSRWPSFSPAKDPAAYPYFKGEISRWTWRIVTQRLTPAGRWFAVATGVFNGYAGASLQLQGYVVAGYAAVLWIVAALVSALYRPRVKLRVSMSDRCAAGQTMPVQFDLEQLSRFRGADLRIVPHNLGLAIDSLPSDGVALPELKRGQSTCAKLGLLCSKRGKHVVRGFRVETDFPFGLIRARRTFREPRTVLVFPTFTPLAQLELPTGRRYQPGGVALASQIGESFEYLGNREYRQGDNIRDIDWRATARMQRPIVREWVEEYMLRVAVVLDTHVPASSKQDRIDAFERAVSISAAVSDYMARQDYLVDLFAAGPNLYHLTAGRSLGYLDQILDILACVDSSAAEPFETIEPQVAELMGRISTVICVLLDWDETRRQFVRRIAEQGVAVKVIIVRDAPCTLEPGTESLTLGAVPVVSKQDYERGVDEL